MNDRRMLRGVPIAIFVVASIGCGGPTDGRLQVTGKVTFDGQPVADGYVTLSPLGSGPSAGGKIEDGKFTIEREKGPVTGKYRIVVQAMRETGRMIPIDPALPDDKVAETVQYLPPRYNTQSQLKADLSPENTDLVLDLSSTKP